MIWIKITITIFATGYLASFARYAKNRGNKTCFGTMILLTALILAIFVANII